MGILNSQTFLMAILCVLAMLGMFSLHMVIKCAIRDREYNRRLNAAIEARSTGGNVNNYVAAREGDGYVMEGQAGGYNTIGDVHHLAPEHPESFSNNKWKGNTKPKKGEK